MPQKEQEYKRNLIRSRQQSAFDQEADERTATQQSIDATVERIIALLETRASIEEVQAAYRNTVRALTEKLGVDLKDLHRQADEHGWEEQELLNRSTPYVDAYHETVVRLAEDIDAYRARVQER